MAAHAGRALPRAVVLWATRIVLIGAFVVHIVAAYHLTRMNQKARRPSTQAQFKNGKLTASVRELSRASAEALV